MASSTTPRVPQDRFLCENPFRALAVGSAEPIASLRRKADSAAKAAKVGLAPDVPYHDLLGTFQLEELPNAIRVMVTDSKRRTGYRLMWPLSKESIPLISRGESAETIQIPSEELAQILFLNSWISYLNTGSAVDAADAFERWEELYVNEVMDQRLLELLIEEDDISRESALDIVLDAQRTIALSILSRVSADAASAWEAGQTSKAAQLIEAVLNSPIDDDLEEVALEPIADSAHRLEEIVQATINQMGEWQLGDSVEPPREVVQLERIANVMRGRLPAAKDWEDTAHRWMTALVWCMRQEGMRLNQSDDNEGALDVIRSALTLANTSEQKTKLQDDLGQLEKIVAEEKTEEAYAAIKSINSAPSLRTVNGFGTKVYGHEQFPADQSLYFTVLYFTAAYIPIFPIARYLVKDGAGGGWHFLGKARWTQWMKIHFAVSCLFGLAFCLYLANGGFGASNDSSFPQATASGTTNSPLSNRGPESTESTESTESMTSPVSENTQPAEPVAETKKSTSQFNTAKRSNIDSDNQIAEQKARAKKREELERDLQALKKEISALKSKVSEEGAVLDVQRSTLDNLKAEIDASDPDRYSQEEIDAYNAKVDRYEGLRAEFNDAVQNYNGIVNLEKKKVRRHNEIVDTLNASR